MEITSGSSNLDRQKEQAYNFMENDYDREILCIRGIFHEEKPMIDIHTHLLFGVDDGPESLEESVSMLQKAASQGVTTIILTPHYRHGMFPYKRDVIIENYKKLLPYGKEEGIALYLGCEYHVNSRIIEAITSKRVFTLANSSYVLTEYEYHTEYDYIEKMSQQLISHGFVPVIAHVERYGCLLKEPQNVEQLRRMGAMIQVNAPAVIGKDDWMRKRFCKKLLEQGWVDMIGSDSHGVKNRPCRLGDCRDYLMKKYDSSYVDKLLHQNPAKILEES